MEAGQREWVEQMLLKLERSQSPSEIHQRIFEHVPASIIIQAIQNSEIIRNGLLNWNLSCFTSEQLISIYDYLKTSAADDVLDAQTIDSLKEKIILFLPTAFKRFAEDVARLLKGTRKGYPEPQDYLEPHYLYCYFNEIQTVVEDLNASNQQQRKEKVTDFLRQINYRNDIVQKFCHKIAGVTGEGGVRWRSKIDPGQEDWFIHLLFWHATDYVRDRSPPSPQNRETILEHWTRFLGNVRKLFGPEIQLKLEKCTGTASASAILITYRDYIVERCWHSHLEEINRHHNLEDMQAYPAFMIFQGIDKAYDFFRREESAIEFIKGWETRSTIVLCRHLWANFEDSDEVIVADITSPVCG
ncbi:hypothetical protein TWF718_006854 [Orbilia javanica]|uniref:Uncharacterized protein n=1 Tax=Orbilia javanica TaxID=47235 RepID=A0AAN8MXG9_9PEZI